MPKQDRKRKASDETTEGVGEISQQTLKDVEQETCADNDVGQEGEGPPSPQTVVVATLKPEKRKNKTIPQKRALYSNAEFGSFLELRSAVEKYQKDNSVQLIVKDSKLLKAESTRKIIPKVYHRVKQDLMYHSITYVCKCHGELRAKPGTRYKNIGQKRLSCPMYIRFKLSPDLQSLVVFDLYETHNHPVDPTTTQLTPRQQVYHLSRIKRQRLGSGTEEAAELGGSSPPHNNSSVLKERPTSDASSEPVPPPPSKSVDTHPSQAESLSQSADSKDGPSTSDGEEEEEEFPQRPASPLDNSRPASPLDNSRPASPLDSESSCSDSDEEDVRNNRRLLPYPIRLIGSAINSNPELIASTKELLEIQKAKLNLEKQKLLMETKLLELTNTKLELEVKQLQRALETDTPQSQDTTIYLQA